MLPVTWRLSTSRVYAVVYFPRCKNLRAETCVCLPVPWMPRCTPGSFKIPRASLLSNSTWSRATARTIPSICSLNKLSRKCDPGLRALPDPPKSTCFVELLTSFKSSHLSQGRFSEVLRAALQFRLFGHLKGCDIENLDVVSHASGPIITVYAVGAWSIEIL